MACCLLAVVEKNCFTAPSYLDAQSNGQYCNKQSLKIVAQRRVEDCTTERYWIWTYKKMSRNVAGLKSALRGEMG